MGADRYGVAAEFVVIICLRETGRVEDIWNELFTLLYTYREQSNAGLAMLFRRIIYLGTFIFNTSANEREKERR